MKKDIRLDVGDIFYDSSSPNVFIIRKVLDDGNKFAITRVYPIYGYEDNSITYVSRYDILAFSSDFLERGTEEHEEFIEFLLNFRREFQGLYDIPAYLNFMKDDKNNDLLYKCIDVEYDMFDSIDEALDMINDLNILYAEFGDEYYIKRKKEIIQDLKDELIVEFKL